MSQDYETDVSREYAMLGNDAILKCKLPSFVADFVAIVSWVDSENQVFFANNQGKHWHLVIKPLRKSHRFCAKTLGFSVTVE